MSPKIVLLSIAALALGAFAEDHQNGRELADAPAPAPAPAECDAGAALPKVQEATMEMSAAGTDCGKLEAASKKMKDAIKDANCDNNENLKASMDALDKNMEAAGCDASAEARRMVATSLPLLAALGLLGVLLK